MRSVEPSALLRSIHHIAKLLRGAMQGRCIFRGIRGTVDLARKKCS